MIQLVLTSSLVEAITTRNSKVRSGVALDTVASISSFFFNAASSPFLFLAAILPSSVSPHERKNARKTARKTAISSTYPIIGLSLLISVIIGSSYNFILGGADDHLEIQVKDAIDSTSTIGVTPLAPIDVLGLHSHVSTDLFDNPDKHGSWNDPDGYNVYQDLGHNAIDLIFLGFGNGGWCIDVRVEDAKQLMHEETRARNLSDESKNTPNIYLVVQMVKVMIVAAMITLTVWQVYRSLSVPIVTATSLSSFILHRTSISRDAGASRLHRKLTSKRLTHLLLHCLVLACILMVSDALNITDGTTIGSLTTWTSVDSPVYVAGLVSIGFGGTLGINAGVVVVFETQDAGITVNSGGQLIILGDLNDRVSLQALGESWAGIRFEAGSAQATFDENYNYVSGSTIQYSDILRAGYSPSTSHQTKYGLSLLNGVSPYLLGVDMIDCGGYYRGSAIHMSSLKGFFVARNVRVLKAEGTSSYYPRYGIYLYDNENDSGLAVIENVEVDIPMRSYSLNIYGIDYASITQSSFANQVYLSTISEASIDGSTFLGILYLDYIGDNVRGKLDVTGNTVSIPGANQEAMVVRWLQTSSSRPSFISGNSIVNGRLYLYFNYNYCNVTVQDNMIQGSSGRGGLYLQNYAAAYVRNNTIAGCTATSSSYPVVQLFAYTNILHFEGNTVHDNQGYYIFSLTGRSNFASMSYMFRRNIVYGNTGTNSLVYLNQYPWTSFDRNIFEDNDSPISVEVYMPSYQDDFISLRSNYWGNFQADITDLRETVIDAFVQTTGPIVDFDPLLSGPSIDSELISIELPGLFRSDGSVGGLVRNGTFVLSNAEYVANTTIIIAEGGHLTIGPNANISFASGRGILVGDSGKLSVDGPALLDASNALESWVGILLKTSNDTQIRGAIIRNAENGIKSSSPGLVNVEDTLIESASSDGIVLEGGYSTASVVLSNVQIDNPGSDAIYASSFRGSFTMSNSTVIGGYWGVYAYYTSSITLIDNVLEESFRTLYIYQPSNFATIERNSVSCQYQCIYLYTYYDSTASVVGNSVKGADITSPSALQLMYILSYKRYSDYLLLEDNSFGNWQPRLNYDALYADIRQTSGETGDISLSNNRFYNITARHVFNLFFRTSQVPVNVANLYDSNLEALDATYPSVFHIADWPETCGGGACSLVGNIFNYSLSPGQYHLAVPVSVAEVDSIDAKLSYWGAEDESLVVQTIFDGRDDAGFSSIKYLPYLLTSDPSGDRSSNETSLPFLLPGSILSGILREGDSVTLDAAGSPYESDGSLIIDGFLEIMPNVTIHMKASSSMVIRKGNMKAVGRDDAPILFTSLTETWSGVVVNELYAVSPGFKLLLAYDESNSYSYSLGKEEFNRLFDESESKVLYRYCPQCTASHKNIFYKRSAGPPPAFDAYGAMTCDWSSINNTFNSDFELYGSLEDLAAGSSNRWAFCEFLSGFGFPGRCGPSSRTYYQSSEYLGTCPTSIASYRDEVYWLLYDPQLPGEEFAPEWFPSDMATSGIPLFLTWVEGIDLEHVTFTDGGFGGDYSLSINRPSSNTYKDISVIDGLGNGVFVKGGSSSFENLYIESDISSSGSAVYIGERTDVAINGLYISTIHNGNAIYSTRAGSLSFTNVELRPRYSYQRGFYISYADSLSIDGLLFNQATSLQRNHVIYCTYLAKNASITNSYIDASKLYRTYAMDFLYSNYDSTLKMVNVTLSRGASSNYFYNLIRILRARAVSFHENTIIGAQSLYNGYSTISVQQVSSCFALNNTFSDVTGRGHVMDITTTTSLELSNNRFEGCTIVEAQEYAIVAINSPSINAQGNVFGGSSGYAIAQFGSSVNALNFARNAIEDPSVQFYVKTTQLYTVGNGIVIGPNYWNTTSFKQLNMGAFDSTYDSDLTTIVFESLFIDRAMTQIILSPPSQVILDEVEMTISGTVDDDLLIVVPAGLYYAPGSIILRHPNAILVLEAGVRIMFAPYASIRVDQGMLKVLGDIDNPVLLAPTQDLLAEYGDASIESSSLFDGIYFGANSNPTVLGGGNTYVSGSVIRHCVLEYGGYFSKTASIYLDRVSVALDQVTILGKWDRSVTGVYINRPLDPVLLRGVNVTNAGSYGVYVYFPTSTTEIVDTAIEGSRNYGLYLNQVKETNVVRSSVHNNDESNSNSIQVYGYSGSGDFNVTSCSVANNGYGYGMYLIYGSSRRYSITSSTFTQLNRPIYMLGSYQHAVKVSLNRFSENSCTISNCRSIEIDYFGSLIFQGNDLEFNTASQIVSIYARSGYHLPLQGTVISGNIFRQNSVPASTSGSAAVLAMRGSSPSTWIVQGNDFNNPISLYEMSSWGFTSTVVPSNIINATNNFFSFANDNDLSASLIDNRLYDNEEGANPEIIFEPYLSSNSTIVCPGNCTTNGICVFPGLCVCADGWSGENCNTPTCASLDFCNGGNGVCSDFDECSCNEGWLGVSCDTANCTLRNDCNENGFCAIPNVCQCSTGYDGIDCDECASNYRDVDGACIPCPVCQNGGTCNSEAKCDCPSNFEGDTCNECAEGFFGLACQPFPYIISTIPSDAIDVGGVIVKVSGYNFGQVANDTGIYRCQFGGIEQVDATLTEDNELTCISPVVQLSGAGSLNTFVRVYVDDQASYNTASFSFYGKCPDNECVQGFCSFGRCVCYYGYRGDSCDEQLFAPVIADPPDDTFELVEGESFSYQLETTQGSTPIDWAIVSVPIEGMTLDASTGLLSWENPPARSTFFYVRVQATNELTRSTAVQFAFHVTPSYEVVVFTDPASYVRPSQVIYFDFLTRDITTKVPVGNKLAVLWVNEESSSPGRRRKLTVKTNSFGTFRRFYQPYSTDAGVFVYGGEHPTYNDLAVQGEFSIMGIDVIPSYYYFRSFPSEGEIVGDAFTFRFKGGSFSGINATFNQENDITILPSLSSTIANSTQDTVLMSLDIASSTSLRGPVYFTVSTNEGVEVISYVYVDIRFRRPKLRVSPNVIDIEAAQGGNAKYYDVVVQNIGSLASSTIEIISPEQGIIRPATNFISGLEVDEISTVSFQVLVPEIVEIGTSFRGTFGFASNNSDTAALDYQITIVSTVPAILTVVTQNEATFLSEEKPNLDNVNVRVRSLSVGTVYSGSSGANGTIVFNDLVEGFYEITAQKLSHASFRTTIFLESPGDLVEAFLQYESVSYTFSVVPVEVTDKYEIIVESTFSTDVPAPVILWDPVYLDWDSLRSGLIDSFQLTATNIGFIAVDNLIFTVGDYFENVAFITPNENNLGRLSANSSLSFPVEVVQFTRYNVPVGWVELRGQDPNNVVFAPEDPDVSDGLEFIVIGADDPSSQWYYKFAGNNSITYDEGDMVFSYSYKDRVRYDYVYNGTFDNGTAIPVDVIVTNNTNLTISTRRLFDGLPLPLVERHLVEIDNPWACAKLAACIACKLYLGKLKYVGAAVKAINNSPVGKVCEKIGKYTSVGKFGFSVGIPTPKPIGDVCDSPLFDPCKLVCESENIGGCAEYECNGVKKICLDISIPKTDCEITFEPSPSGGVSPGGGGGGGGCSRCGYGGSSSTSTLEPCRQDGGSRRALQQSLFMPAHVTPYHRSLINGCTECPADDLKTVFRAVDNRQDALLEMETALTTCIEESKSTSSSTKTIFPCIFRRTFEILALMPLLSDVIKCQLSREVCYDSSDLLNNPGLANLFIQASRFETMIDLVLLPYSGSIFEDASADVETFDSELAAAFGGSLVNAMADGSADGEYITESELEELLNVGLIIPNEIDVIEFASTWNQSLTLWNQGVFSSDDLPTNFTSQFFDIEQAVIQMQNYENARTRIQEEFFSSFSDAWLTAVEAQQLEEAKQLAGVCASVRVRIEQELTLTRVGFEARLEILNDGDFPLENVTVTLRASAFGNATVDATSRFVFDEPVLEGVTSVDGGVIDPSSNAKATWLILALTEAAPVFDTKYDVSGILRYTIEGVGYIQNLAPDTITVKPDPQLYLKYFHSRNVFADNPFTLEIEPSIPYQLGLLIENRGYGDANNVEILSSQPEIVDNEKGLLVEFTIVGSRLGNTETTAKTLNIDFGNIPSRSNAIGVWDMISTLRGRFNNFTATFQYKGPINDDRLSLIESVEIYELTHIVRVDGNHPSALGLGYIEDGFDDFLANLNPDAFYAPDHVFTSDTRQGNFTVASVIDKANVTSINQISPNEVAVIVRHDLSVQELSLLPDWVYVRFNDPLSGTDFFLHSATRTDEEYTLIPKFNSWQTAWDEYLLSGDIEKLDYIHLFDFGVAPEYRLVYYKQPPPSNLEVVEVTNSSLIVEWNIAEGVGEYALVLFKRASLSDGYYNAAKSFLPDDLSTFTIRGLASGTTYTIKVISGRDGQYENSGATVVATTIGVSECGNGVVDDGEECDEGAQNGSGVVGECNDECVFTVESEESDQPSIQPSRKPSNAPSSQPSSEPSSQPSITPSMSSAPSHQPSFVPSLSDKPSSHPSHHPSLSMNPSSMPSSQPSSIPSLTPSLTKTPSATPSESPSTSTIPSGLPSGHPSVSDWPTSLPSSQPSSFPSRYPSVSSAPSFQPSENPSSSDWPTRQPSGSPSISGKPSSLPSDQPSPEPSMNPSLSSTPSSHPSRIPSVSGQPSSNPTEMPSASAFPSSQPSEYPSSSAWPTTRPSERPSISFSPTPQPSSSPTQDPTGAPTAQPTQQPTPVPTAAPTMTPTAAPTAQPTPQPTTSPTPWPTASPTQEPTNTPTLAPSPAPTPAPTLVPTREPTAAPTSEPTPSPTLQPTPVPTSEPSPISSCTPFELNLEGSSIFVEGSSGAPDSNGDLAVTVSSSSLDGLTYLWNTTCPNSTIFNETTSTPHMSIDAGAQPSVCEIEVEVCGSCLVCKKSSGIVAVVDPLAGFVIGGGWIMSLEGAYPSIPSATSKANFGFISKYKKGQSMPSGNTKFKFSGGEFEFVSTAYSWLVITGSNCAKFKGTGQITEDGVINDTDHGFMLTACDGNKLGTDDTFRIKIWSTLDGVVVYDNMMDLDDSSYDGTSIGGGNIMIKQPGEKPKKKLTHATHERLFPT